MLISGNKYWRDLLIYLIPHRQNFNVTLINTGKYNFPKVIVKIGPSDILISDVGKLRSVNYVTVEKMDYDMVDYSNDFFIKVFVNRYDYFKLTIEIPGIIFWMNSKMEKAPVIGKKGYRFESDISGFNPVSSLISLFAD